MLKRLAILTVLILGCVYVAWSQVPRNGSKQDRPTQEEADGSKPTQPPPTPLQIQLAPAKQEESAQQKPPGYPWKELLAPASMPNWLLCLVGGFAGWAAFKTLKAISRQADLMKEQSDLMISKERANVRVEIGELEVGQFNDREWRARVVILVSNFGETKAFPTSASAAMLLSPTGERQTKDYAGALVNVSAIFPTTEKPLKAQIWIMDGMDEESIWKLNTENAYAQLYGHIDYEDVFGGKHRTAFRYVWRADGWMAPVGDGDPDLIKTLCGGWEQAGSESDNEAY